jgi:hypothetical protein
MNLRGKIAIRSLFASIAWMGAVVSTAAQTCVPPPGFVDTPAPTVAAVKELVSHTEETTIDGQLAVVLDSIDKPLEDTIHKTSSLPGVSGSHMLTNGEFGAPGSRRLNCLSDGSTLVEQVLASERNTNTFRFRYVVWNYTTEKARPIEYGVGEFYYSDVGGGRTHVTWTYSFQLNRHRFPGYLGSVGNFIFRVGFLNREYADLMRGVLAGIKSDAEQLANDRVPDTRK